jgi:leader peptidase (prepilin peptidase)/N-methyltransferase
LSSSPPSSFAEIAVALPWLFPAVAFLVGACVGSFLNVVISRLPAGESIVRPGSHCACGAPIAWHDNLPILSWLLRRGRARCCGRPFSVRYLVVELLTALAFLACWRLFSPAHAVCGWIFLSGLIGATFIDLDHLMIPDAFSLGLGVLGVVLSFLVPTLHGQGGDFFALASLRSGADGLLGLLLGSGLVLWIALLAGAVLKKEAMGLGDVKFAGAIGAFCGWRGAVFALFGGAMLGTVWLGLVVLGRKILHPSSAPSAFSAARPSSGEEPALLSEEPALLSEEPPPPSEEPASLTVGTRVPFGPMLAAGGALYFLALHGPIDAWFAKFTELF